MRALGLMSGTSMDGVDAAVLETDGETIAGFGPSAFVPYARGGARGCCARRSGAGRASRGSRRSRRWCAAAHAAAVAAVRRARSRRLSRADAGARAAGRGTHQVGRGRLAGAGGRACRWSGTSARRTSPAAARGRRWCRSSTSPARGGSGRRRRWRSSTSGGSANVTWVDPRAAAPEAEGALVAFDTGPGNALIDDFLRAAGAAGLRCGRSGRGGGAGATTACSAGLADASLHREGAAEVARPAGFPRLPRPVSRAFDRGRGGDAGGADGRLRGGGGAAFSRAGRPVARLRRRAAEPDADGDAGGAANAPVEPVEAVGLDGDMLEAQAFAYLAVRVLRGLPTSAPGDHRGAAAGLGRAGQPAAESVALVRRNVARSILRLYWKGENAVKGCGDVTPRPSPARPSGRWR